MDEVLGELLKYRLSLGSSSEAEDEVDELFLVEREKLIYLHVIFLRMMFFPEVRVRFH